MMRLPPFRYLAPVSVADAVKLMADHGPEAMLVLLVTREAKLGLIFLELKRTAAELVRLL